MPRHTIACASVRPDKLREAVESRHCCAFRTLMLTAGADRGLRSLPPQRAARREHCRSRRYIHHYTIGSKDTNGYLFLVSYHDKTIIWSINSISDGRGFEELSAYCSVPENCGFLLRAKRSVRGMDTRWSHKGERQLRQLADRGPRRTSGKTGSQLHPRAQWGADGSEVVTEVTFPFFSCTIYAKSIGVSPLSVLAPLMMKAFDDKFGGTDKPVIAEIPVDLRPLPTLTTRYFICFIDLPYFPEYRDLPNDEVFRRTKAFLKDQMQREQLLYRAKAAADRCESLHEARHAARRENAGGTEGHD